MRTLVLGDIHGGFKSMKQCFERSKFDYAKDRLIVLGDVCDGWPHTYECIKELLKIVHLILIVGNHDIWLLEWFLYDKRPHIWTSQGGQATINSYEKNNLIPPISHIEFLKNGEPYFIENNRLFVHGGINHHIPIDKNTMETLTWDRDLLMEAFKTHKKDPSAKVTSYDEIVVGHTTTSFFNTLLPTHYCEVWNLDTGGGWEGKLTIMDIDTKEYWQSDMVADLYPETLHGKYAKKSIIPTVNMP